MERCSRWAQWEVTFLLKNYRKLGATGCHVKLSHRSVPALYVAARKLGLKFEYISKFNLKDACRLYQSRQMTTGQLAKHFGMTAGGIRYQFRIHGVKRRPAFDGIKKNGYWEIPLTRGHVALVDDRDYELISKKKWALFINQDGKKYAIAGGSKNNVRTTYYMHRVIMKAKKGVMVDHESANTLDNRRNNLRHANKFQNQWNRKFKGNEVGFKGVRPNGLRGWSARITKMGKTHCLGTYPNPAQAAEAYDKAAKKLFGKFAEVNFK
jgi:hypothetical protein